MGDQERGGEASLPEAQDLILHPHPGEGVESAERLIELGARLRRLETRDAPFADARPIPRGTHWTRPDLVAQIGFAEWTPDGRLRQPRFLGLRDDKPAAEVVRERAT